MAEELHLSDERVDCDAATRDLNASYHLAVVASDVLLDSELLDQGLSSVPLMASLNTVSDSAASWPFLFMWVFFFSFSLSRA